MRGQCLCGNVRFDVKSAPEVASVCHCSECRKQAGHVWSSSHVPDGDLIITGEVRWFQSSEKARRGFCPTCGAFLFWKHADDDHTSFSLGAIEGDTGLSLTRHIFTADKGDYYEITDGVPQS